MAFDNIIGNSKVKNILTKVVNEDRVLHAYIFSGLDGIGKQLYAKEFAKQILCLSNPKPCNSCKSCIEFDDGNNPDFTMIEPDGNQIKIEQIRFLNEKIAEKPIISAKKVYVINDADKMNDSAQNALLKTIEEPPKYSVIILVTSNILKLLTTIRSRCNVVSFLPLKSSEIEEFFRNNFNKEIDNNLLNMAQGSIGKAIELQDNEEELLNFNKILDNLERMEKCDVFNKFSSLYDLNKDKKKLNEYLEYMNVKFIEKAKQNLSYVECINYVEEAKLRLQGNSNFTMTIDDMLLKIWEELNEKYSRS